MTLTSNLEQVRLEQTPEDHSVLQKLKLILEFHTRFLHAEELMRSLNVTLEFLWYFLEIVNCTDWTDSNTRTAINTLVWVNKKLVVAFVNTLARTDFDAGLFFVTDTSLGDDRISIFHACILQRISRFVLDLSQTRIFYGSSAS